MELTTAHLRLEPITATHTEELWKLLNDPALHRYLPSAPLPMDKLRERCSRWETRMSPDGSERWLNWLARDLKTSQVVAHFQAGVNGDGIATLAYVVAVSVQRKGIATDGLGTILAYLKTIGVSEVKAWSDTRNEASHRLAKKLGMVQIERIEKADFFKGESSDELVFSKFL